MKMALDRRGVPADEVDLINPHGTSTPLGDKREAEAIWTVFGDEPPDARTLAISATKSMTGHMMGAAGAFEAFATVMSVAEQCVPATLNYRDPDPECDLWVVHRDPRTPDPLRPVQQHRPGRPQRRRHLQALRRRLSRPASAGGLVARRHSDRPAVATIRRPMPVEAGSPSLPELDPARRAVVTGLGAVMPIGNDFPTYWSNLVAGVSGTRPDPVVRPDRLRGPDRRRGPRLRPDDRDGRQDGPSDEPLHPLRDGAPARRPWRDSGIDFAAMSQDERDRVGVVINTGGGGIEQIIDGTHVPTTKGPRFVSPFAVPALSGSMAACMLSMEYGLTGPVITQVAACASIVIAFHDALRLIRAGECDVVLDRRLGGADPADGHRRPRQHGRAVEAQRRSRARLAAVRPRRATASCSARAAGWSSSNRSSTPSARGATPHRPRSSAAP